MTELLYVSVTKSTEEWLNIYRQAFVVVWLTLEPKVQQRLSHVSNRMVDCPCHRLLGVYLNLMRQVHYATAKIQEDYFVLICQLGYRFQPPCEAVRKF